MIKDISLVLKDTQKLLGVVVKLMQYMPWIKESDPEGLLLKMADDLEEDADALVQSINDRTLVILKATEGGIKDGYNASDTL